MLPGKVSKRLVGVSHAVRVFTFGVGDAFFLVGRQQFVGQLQVRRHGPSCRGPHPESSVAQTLLACTIDLHWNLVTGTTDSLAANFDVWLDVFDRRLEDFDRSLIGKFVCAARFLSNAS